MASVDYERVASTYQSGRSAVAHEDAWRPLVTPYLPDRSPLHVLDLGAGTGIFSRVWPDWGAAHVVALDPALPMLGQARRTGLPDQVSPVNARGEWLPLREGCVDAVWISTVFHHLTDRTRCVEDLARVLRGPDSVVLVRGMFPDRWDGGWHHVFPGIERAIGRFPSLEVVTEVFERAGFAFRGVEGVPEQTATGDAVAAWVRRMRDADTLLLGLTDDEIAAGLATLDRIADDDISGPTLEAAAFAL
jgi:SAM-dependent methyltransferase